MRAVVPVDTGTVGFAEVDEVRPSAGEMVIEVAAFSINRGETFQLEAPRAGWRPGKDIAGRVIEAGPTGPPVGTRVVAHLPHSGWAEHVTAPATQVAVLPDSISFDQAAALPLAGLTALRLLRTAGSVIGRRILLTGAAGGVGHYFTELAAGAGASVTAVVSSPARGERLLELGAETLVYDVSDARGPFDLVLESVGGESLPVALSKLVPGGDLIWFGEASRQPVTLDFFDFFTAPEAARIRHFHYIQGRDDEDLATLVRLVGSGRLHPELGRVEDWSRTDAVLDDLRHRRIRGNAVLTLPSTSHEEATPMDPRTVVTRYVEAVAAGDVATIRASFAPDVVWIYPGDLPLSGDWKGRDMVVDEFLGAAAGNLFAPGAPVTITLVNVVADGEQVFAEWTAQATARNGDAYDNRCGGVFTVRDGVIVAVREYLDTDHARRVLFANEQ
ncbi:NADPH:quinone reductase-like Zn-dependent oxidoreductase [Kribbella sp. VKM Ac-2569]|uniref:nuclear transport factor 2 family protein n=1 Tax=Kribbella sp. VKM Ac-2569 TaxID=2512220 RepID=UPI00102C718C|nr:nuclear transport factor 2 family protein [Kribbella sp. VKM Ac-2569]RZT27070.1 NADPH:quinone reductase-like Zn-dependent oxidoreductase [Kribbella sp. VKM Ac-2569]